VLVLYWPEDWSPPEVHNATGNEVLQLIFDEKERKERKNGEYCVGNFVERCKAIPV
jgi:hypothetical protein